MILEMDVLELRLLWFIFFGFKVLKVDGKFWKIDKFDMDGVLDCFWRELVSIFCFILFVMSCYVFE